MNNGATLEVEREATTVVVRLRGEIDLANSVDVRGCLFAYSCEYVILDCSRLTFMDASGIGTIVAAQERARAGGGRLVLFGLPAPQLRLLEVTGLLHFFDGIIPD